MDEFDRRTVTGALGCLIGQMLGSSLLANAALPLLLLPITAEFGWTATAFSAAVSFMMICGACSGPLIGRLIDRLGPKPVILSGTAVVGLVTLSLAATDRRIWLFYIAHALLGMFGTTALGYVKLIGELFAKNRAKALAVFGVEAALAGSVAPLLIETVLSAQGWRAVYFVLGAIILATVPVLFLLLPGRARATAEEDRPSTEGGVPPSAALTTAAMWLLVAAVVFGAAPRLGFVTYIVPFFVTHGFDTGDAARAIALLTVSGLVGSLFAGVLMDRFSTPLIAIPLQLLGLVSVLALPLLDGTVGGLPALALISLLFGFTLQTHLPLMSYFLARFFKLAHFGQIYGVAVAVVAIGIALVVPAIGTIIESRAGYTGAIALMAGGLVLSTMLYLRLGTLPEAALERGKLPK